ncbi:hypothetical protein AAKU67_002062 [Oxalobacteraceae bacterium GrIS 2.11]
MSFKQTFTSHAKFIAFAFCILFANLSGAETRLNITYAHNASDEIATGDQLKALLLKYDLSKWILTKEIVIDNASIPHSHPVLTLHARHLKDDELLLSTFIHEQMHWLLAEQKDWTPRAIVDLKIQFPTTPFGFPEASNDEEGNYEHLLVIALEWRADRELLGELRAREVMEFWANDHYTWIYRTVLENRRKIDDIIRKRNLMPG